MFTTQSRLLRSDAVSASTASDLLVLRPKIFRTAQAARLYIGGEQALLPRPATLPDTAIRRRSVAATASAAQRRQQALQETASEEEDVSEEVEQQQQQGAREVAAERAGGEPEAAQAQPALPAETEAVAGPSAPQQQLVTEEVVEEVEQVIEPLTFQSAMARSRSFLTTTLPGKLIVGGVAALFLGTLSLAVYRAWEKSNTAQAKRLRQIDRNRDLVDGINKYLLAGNRAGLTPGVLRGLQRSSGFTTVEVFRKYLWYLLRERKFDQGAVEDLVALKVGLGLTDADVGEALRERSARIYEKYGTLMLNTEGLTLGGAQRKATCTALFRKVLYLAEWERLVGQAATEPGGSGADSIADIGKIFGATLEDMERLRIRNLYEAELDLEGMMAESTDEEGPAAAGDAPAEGKDKK